MAKKKQKKPQRSTYRNAAPSPPRAPRAPRPPSKHPEEETPAQRLAYTAAGAAGTAFVGGFLAKQKWQPKTIAGVLTAVGTAMAWAGKTPRLQSIGAGTMGAGGGQLVLQVMDDHEKAVNEEKARNDTKRNPPPDAKLKNAAGLRPGALESAYERARTHMGMMADDDAGGFS